MVPTSAPSRPERRSWKASLALGLLAVLLVGAAVVGVVGLPLILWAGSTEPSKGTSRPFVRTGLHVLPWVAAVVGVASGGVAVWWHRTGRTVPMPPPSPGR